MVQTLRDAETDFRRCYARVLAVVSEWEEQNAGPVTGFGTTAHLLVGVLNLSKSEAKARVEQAGLLTPRRSLSGQPFPPTLPTTAAELAADAIGPAHLRVITATMHRVPTATVAQAEQTLATAARRFDPAALTRIGERLLAHLDPDGKAPTDAPEELRELLCEYHHAIVHRQGWHIRLDARGHPEFIPPKTVDPTRAPLHDPLRQ